MGSCCSPVADEEICGPARKIIMHPLFLPKPSPWFDLRVFYVRVSNCEVNESTPDHLIVNHIPLTPDTVLEVNGRRSSVNSERIASLLRRDRVDKKSEEAIFVSTDTVRMNGSVRFEVYDKDDMQVFGVLEFSNESGLNGEFKNYSKKWGMRCQAAVQTGAGFPRGALGMSLETAPPTIEVYVAGCFAGVPIIMAKALQFQKKHQMKAVLDSVPESKTIGLANDAPSANSLQLSEYRCYEPETNGNANYSSFYSRAECMGGEDGELSWFNDGVRVGVGIGLGICLGIGIGVGLLIQSYQATTASFKRRLI